MIDDELHRAARDLRRQVDTLVPPPIQPQRQFGGRLLLVAASIAVFAAGGLLVANRFGGSSGETDGSPADGITDGVSSTMIDDDDRVEPVERPVALPLPDLLIGDGEHRPATPLARPRLGTPSIEPEFSTSIIGVTEAEAGEVVVPVPGGAPSWNADGSLLVLYEQTEGWTGHALYDGRTFQRLRGLDLDPADVEELYWDPGDADRLFHVSEGDFGVDGSTHALMAYSVNAASSTPVHHFAGCDDVHSKGVARPISDDGRRLGFLCRSGDGLELVAVDLGTDSQIRQPATTGDVGPVPTPAGDGYVVLSESGVLKLLDLELQPTGRSFTVGTNLFLLTATEDGRQLFVTTVYDEPADAIGSVVAFDLATDRATVVVGQQSGFPYPPSGTRLATSAGGNGLVAVAMIGRTETAGQDTLDGEILVVDLNRPEPTMGRLGHHRAALVNRDIETYFAAPSPAIDPAGRRVLFSSDWGEDRVDTFMIDLDPAPVGDDDQ